MSKSIYLLIALLFIIKVFNAQTTAMNFNKKDCNGTMHNLFADLDAGNAVVLFYYMSSCGSCPPPALKIQAMANNIMKTYPGKIKAYAIPFNDVTTCNYTNTWVSSNGLSLYTPMDSGAAQVAYYGGFGMPTVVLVGGTDHKILFSTMSFSTSDTSIMKNKILSLFGANGINDVQNFTLNVAVYPNPATDNISITLTLNETSNLLLELVDITGKQVALLMDEKQSGIVTKQFSTTELPNGIYLVRLQVNGQTSFHKLIINH